MPYGMVTYMPLQSAEDLPDVYSVAEAAAILRISERHARRLIEQGELPALRWGRLVRIPRLQLERLIAGETPRAET